MKATTLLAAALAAASLLAAGCGGSTNVNVSTNRASNASNLSPTGGTGNSNTALNTSNMNSAANAAAPTAMSDNDFLKEAAIGGMSEVELGKLAASKATNPQVKSFGQMMVTDHSKANDELKALAAKKNIQLPTEPDAKHKATLSEMQSKSGADFDRYYVTDIIEDPEKDVAAFETKSQNATDPDIKAWAAKTLPTLKKHLETIRSVQAKMAMSQNK
jgi:putative membrane protein